jgi:AcrR family transcriptional regulator
VLFAEQGYDKTSLREIAEQVGVTKAALYYHFPSKEQILVALFEPVAAMQDQLLEDLRTDVLIDPAVWLPTLERVLHSILGNRRLWALLERNATTLMALNHEGDFAEAHQELHRRTAEFFADPRIPLDARVRLACAFGSIFGVVEMGGSMIFGGSDSDELAPVVMDVVGEILAPVTAPARP